jgi:hypothetical protein
MGNVPEKTRSEIMKTGWIAIVALALITTVSGWGDLIIPTDPVEQEQMFDNVDANNDNCLSYTEVSSAYPFMVSQGQYDSYDINSDDCVDRAELGIAPGDSDSDDGDGGCGCAGCNGTKSTGGDILAVLISLLGLAVMARPSVG